ncbi:MAG: gliding motility-associated C-terminal domain-containing protein [Oceanihabitans sp.]
MKKITFCFALLCYMLSMQMEAQITSYPYLEDFEAGDGGWTVVDVGANSTWALGTPAAGIINAAASGVNAWVTNLTGNYNSNEDGAIVSPVFDFTNLAAPEVQFNLWYDNETGWDGLVLQSSIDGGTSWQNVGAFNDPNNWFNNNGIDGNPGGQQTGWSGTGGQGTNAWVVARHALTGLAGQASVMLRFAFGSDGTVTDEGSAIDDINVYDVTCPEPANLALVNTATTSATIMWDAGGAEPGWEVVAQPAGTGVPTANGVDTTNNAAFVATGLMPSTDYEVYVRSECGTEFSVWVGPLNFTTECTVFTAPYTEDFESAGAIPNCWSMNGNQDWFFTNVGAGNHIGDNGNITGVTNSGGYFAYCDASNDEGPRSLLSPLIDVSALTNPALSFYEISDNEGNANSTLEVEVWDGAAWNLMQTYNTNTTGWELRIIDLSTLTFTDNAQVRFTFSETTTGDFYDDIAIDDVVIDEAPACIIPSNITVTNIAGTTADVNWQMGGTESNWQYVVQAPGTGEPATGTDVGVTMLNLTGLTYSTAYEIYLRADCDGDGFSDWVGPINFTTTEQLNFDVDCSAGPVNNVICYDNDGDVTPVIYTFTSTDGSALNLVVNSGNVENTWDEFIIYDSDGVTELYNGYGNNGDLTGINVQTSGDSVSYYVNSDFVGSCQTSGYNPIDITISCATCINPIAGYTVVDDCDAEEFSIEIDVTSLGDASPLIISNDYNSNTVTVTNTGLSTIGPFPYTSDITVTISSQDANCVLENVFSTGCSIFCIEALPICAGDLAYPSTVGDQEAPDNIDYDCLITQPDPQWNTIIFDEAGDYVFSLDQIDDTGTPADIDFIVWGPFPDQDSGCVALLPENIADCSYSPTASETITLNGVQEGDLFIILITNFSQDPGTYTFTQDSGPPDGTNCEVVCDVSIEYQGVVLTEDPTNMGYTNSIDLCGFPSIELTVDSPYADNFEWYLDGIFISSDLTITATQSGNYQAIAYGGICEDISFSLQVPVNFFDEAVANQAPDLELCDINSNGMGDFDLDSQTATILGSQSNTEFVVSYHATLADAQTGAAALSSPYTAADGTTIYVRVEDIDAVGSNSGCATTNTSFNLIVNALPVANQPQDMEMCDDGTGSASFDLASQDADVIGTQTDVVVSYHISQTAADMGSGALASPYTSTANPQTIYVRIENTITGCSNTTMFNLELIDKPVINQTPPTIYSCDNDEDGMGDYDITENEAVILGGLTGMTVSYHTNQADANTGNAAITNATGYTAAPSIIYVRVEDASTGCFNTTSFSLDLIDRPVVNQAPTILSCDNDDDGIGEYNLTENEAVILGGLTGMTVTYYISQYDADNATAPIANTTNYASSPGTIYVRVEDGSGCYNTTMFDLDLGIEPDTSFSSSVVYEVCPFATNPITVVATANNYLEQDVSINWYYEGAIIAGQNSLELPTVTQAGYYTIEVTFNSTGCSSEEEVEVLEFTSCVIPQAFSPNNDNKNDTFDLSNHDVQSLEVFNRYGIKVFSKTNGYTNQWHGQSDGGEDLPVGTYFYVMKYQGNKTKSSWVYLNK